MKRLLASVFVVGIACCGIVAALSEMPVAAADDKQAVLQADHALEQAIGDSDKTAAKAATGRLLDADFTWTDAAGKTSSRAQFLQSFDDEKAPEFTAGGKNAQVKAYAYGQVGVVQGNAGKMHTLRVWVKRPAGWRALVYHEVKSLDAPPTTAPPGVGKACVNPCKSIPYQPKNEAEKGVLDSYMGLETSALAHNVPDWSAHVAEEFVVASSNSDQILDKPTRIEGLEHEKMAGVAPSPLISVHMFTFGEAVVMTSLHQPDKGKPLHVTRVWVMRNGKWVETLSYQTSIQDAPIKASL